MNQLVERVLPVSSRLAPVDRTRVVRYWNAVDRDTFAIALHDQLLQVRWESFQVLFIRQHSRRLSPKKVVVPHSQQRHEHRQVAFERDRAEVLIHLVKAIQERAEVFWTNG